MFENLSSAAIKEDQELNEPLKNRLHSIFNPLKLCLNDIFLSLKNKKPHSYEVRSRLL